MLLIIILVLVWLFIEAVITIKHQENHIKCLEDSYRQAQLEYQGIADQYYRDTGGL